MDKGRIVYDAISEEQCAQVMDAVYKLLETAGCLVQNPETLKLMGDAGCKVDGEEVKIPRDVLEHAIKVAPSEFTLYNRKGEPAMELKQGNTFFGPCLGTVYTIDVDTREKRTGTYKDACDAALVSCAMQNLDWSACMSSVFDRRSELSDLYEVQALPTNSTKPFMYWVVGREHLDRMIDMYETIAGGEKAFRDKPFNIDLVCPRDPRIHTHEGTDQLMYMARKHLPVVHIPGLGFGGASPIHMAGSIVEGLADTLVGLLISQLASEGAPFVASGIYDYLDMKTFMPSHSWPESDLCSSVTAAIFRYLDIPFNQKYGDTGNGLFDEINAFDIGVQCQTAVMCGSMMNMSAGGLEGGASASLVSLAFNDRAISYAHRMGQAMEINDDTLCVDAIAGVKPGGNFLMDMDTLTNFRDFWEPGISAPRSYDKYLADGRSSMTDRLTEWVKDVVAQGPIEPLASDIQGKIEDSVAEVEQAVAATV